MKQGIHIASPLLIQNNSDGDSVGMGIVSLSPFPPPPPLGYWSPQVPLLTLFSVNQVPPLGSWSSLVPLLTLFSVNQVSLEILVLASSTLNTVQF